MLKSCVGRNRKHRAVGVGNYLVRRCPWQVRGCAQVARRGPHSEHDKICPAVQRLPAVCNQRVGQFAPQVWVNTTGWLLPAPTSPVFAGPDRSVPAGDRVRELLDHVKQSQLGLKFLCQGGRKRGCGEGLRAEVCGINDLSNRNLNWREIFSRTPDCGQPGSAGDFGPTVRTGQGARRKISSALDPSSNFSTPVRPCVPTTSKSISWVRMMSDRLSQTSPSRT